LQLFADVFFRGAVPPDAHEAIAEIGAQPFDEAARVGFRADAEQHRVTRAAPEREQAGAAQVVERDDGARPQTEGSRTVPGLLGHDATDLEGLAAEHDLVTDLQVELREELRPHDRAASAQEIE
jgi:hypothetical protein